MEVSQTCLMERTDTFGTGVARGIGLGGAREGARLLDLWRVECFSPLQGGEWIQQPHRLQLALWGRGPNCSGSSDHGRSCSHSGFQGQDCGWLRWSWDGGVCLLMTWSKVYYSSLLAGTSRSLLLPLWFSIVRPFPIASRIGATRITGLGRAPVCRCSHREPLHSINIVGAGGRTQISA